MFTNTITQKDLAIFQEICTKEQHLKYDIIFNTLESAKKLYIITEGQVKLVTSTEKGKEIILAVRTPEELIGEAFFQDVSEYTMDAIALVDTVSYSMDRKQYLNLIQQVPSFSFVFSKLLTNYLFHAWGQNIIADTPVKIRLAKVFINQAANYSEVLSNGHIKLGVYLTHTELANLVKATRVSVSQAMSQFQKSESITKIGNSYILDLEKLKALIKV